ncbi:MAG: SRPBCC family protein [Candidatus Berkiella sp.]
MAIIKTTVTTLITAIAAVAIYATTKPDDFKVERSHTIKAPSEKIFPLINDFNNWPQWSPWEDLDPNMKKTLKGAHKGVGAISEWEGNNDVGSGKIEIIKSTPNTQIIMQLDMLKPFPATNTVEFSLASVKDETKVTWSMSGKNSFIAKVMSIFINCEKMVGDQFEKGLNKLQKISEK